MPDQAVIRTASWVRRQRKKRCDARMRMQLVRDTRLLDDHHASAAPSMAQLRGSPVLHLLQQLVHGQASLLLALTTKPAGPMDERSALPAENGAFVEDIGRFSDSREADTAEQVAGVLEEERLTAPVSDEPTAEDQPVPEWQQAAPLGAFTKAESAAAVPEPAAAATAAVAPAAATPAAESGEPTPSLWRMEDANEAARTVHRSTTHVPAFSLEAQLAKAAAAAAGEEEEPDTPGMLIVEERNTQTACVVCMYGELLDFSKGVRFVRKMQGQHSSGRHGLRCVYRRRRRQQ